MGQAECQRAGGRHAASTVADAVALCKALEVDLHELLHGLDADDLRALGFGRGM